MPGRRIRFGMVSEVVPTGGGWADHVRRVEQAGVDTLLIRDHLETGPFGPQLAPLAAAAAAAAITTRLRVGTMVLSNDYRHPALVAHEAATIDLISAGRFELGLGAGWLPSEYQQMGIAFEPARTRIARLEESVQIITGLLTGQAVTFHGTYYAIDSLALPVTPLQRPRPPLLIGGGGPKMLALAARHADIAGILPAPIRGGDDGDDPADRSPAALESKLAIMKATAGERFATLELSLFATFQVTNRRRAGTQELIARRGWDGISCEQVWAMPSVFIGSPAQITADLEKRRSSYNLSYYITSDRSLGELAQVIASMR
jgi:probable F420-dependent oxidoreductase